MLTVFGILLAIILWLILASLPFIFWYYLHNINANIKKLAGKQEWE